MSEFIEYLTGLFEDFGEVDARRMFGGHGIFMHGVMFALVADDILYLKTDQSNVEDYRARGLSPFQYHKRGRLVSLSYYAAPEETLEDPAELARWAERAHAAALRAHDRSGKVSSPG